ncbi:hypothetical protein E2562_016520 [Oryza meyeriana var. granulata]|uniref:Uncharacterized protein n=1 Tax=Oryza meyeriana var. granulata TaxID=110450 RepID=A0A6G1C722_9ORYZ|nr:hypothetical protein E2562_016520 [Oryza meyeriana var. granulata]
MRVKTPTAPLPSSPPANRTSPAAHRSASTLLGVALRHKHHVSGAGMMPPQPPLQGGQARLGCALLRVSSEVVVVEMESEGEGDLGVISAALLANRLRLTRDRSAEETMRIELINYPC